MAPHLEHMDLVTVGKENIGKETTGTKTLALVTWLLEEQQALLLLHTRTISCLLSDTTEKTEHWHMLGKSHPF